MSHKVIDLASDEEKEKAGPIDLANSSDEDDGDGVDEDLQIACPKCTLLNAGDADQCVACGNQLREPKPKAWGRADGTPWTQKPKTGGFRIPTRSDVDARKRPPPKDCKPVAASKRAKQLQAAGALRDIEKVTRQKIPAIDRRNDKALGQLDATIMATGVGKKATMPEREGGERNEGGRGGRGRSRVPHRDGVRPEGGGQPHRQRRARPGETPAAPRRERAYNPLAGEKTTPREPRPSDARQHEPRPVGEMKRRPRRRPSNGGKGYAAKG